MHQSSRLAALLLSSLALILGSPSVSDAGQRATGAAPERPLEGWRPIATAGAADGRPGFAVQVQFDVLKQAAVTGGTLTLPLSGTLSVRTAITWSQPGDTQSLIAGPLVDAEGEASLTTVGDALVARVVFEGRLFMVRRAPNSNAHIITEVDQDSLPPEAPPRIPPVSARLNLQRDQSAGTDSGAFVDLMILYTSASRVAIGGTPAMVAELTAAVNNANLALANAGVTHRYRLVHYEEIPYAETGDIGVSLDRLTSETDGYLDNAPVLRNLYRADNIALFTTDSDACGIGWLMGAGNVNASFEGYAYSIVNWSCANAGLTLAHEVGHNMGLNHDRANASAAPPSFSYAYGYAVPGMARDVMAYPCSGPACPRRTIYSTPLFNFPGTSVPAGTATEDGARALNNTSLIVANFRQSCTYAIDPVSTIVGSQGGSASVAVTAPADCLWTAVSGSPAFLTIADGSSGSGDGIVSYAVSSNAGGTRGGTLMIAGQTFAVTQSASEGSPADFDGDSKADIVVFRPSNGTWYFTFSGTGSTAGFQWGSAGDIPVPGDYDGDGRTDIAAFRPSTGTWYIVDSSTGSPTGVQWGNGSDTPVPGDYDGDGRTDIAVFRPANGTWYIVNSSTGSPTGVQWGNDSDAPVPADYNGDGRTDVAVFRPSNGTWYLLHSGIGTTAGLQWGNSADIPVTGDYDGDAKADIAIFRPSNGTWYIVNSTTGIPIGVQWGNGNDTPVPGDYDGDGRTDVAVFRPSNGTWYVVRSSTGTSIGVQWGNGSDIPILKRP